MANSCSTSGQQGSGGGDQSTARRRYSPPEVEAVGSVHDTVLGASLFTGESGHESDRHSAGIGRAPQKPRPGARP